MRKLHILLIALFTFSIFSSCDEEPTLTINDAITGKWFVNTVSQSGYSLNQGADPIVEEYFINFFYGDYMTFLKGDMLDFSYIDMYRTNLDNRRERYNYVFNGNLLELNNGFRICYTILGWNSQEVSICFDKGSLLDYISADMSTANPERYRELAYIRDQVGRYVRDFYITYVLTRNQPSAPQIISGNYYGKLYDAGGPMFNNDWVSATLYRPDYQNCSFILNDQISLQNGILTGPPFNVEVPNLIVGYDKNVAGQIFFEGESYMNHPVYGEIYAHIKGQSFNSQTLDVNISIENAGLVYELYYREGIRYLLEPLFYRSKCQVQEKKVIVLTPKK